MNKKNEEILKEHFYRAMSLLELNDSEYHIEISPLSEFKNRDSELEPIGEMILEDEVKGDKFYLYCRGIKILDSEEIPLEELIKAVYHECRHIWQFNKYPDIWDWWSFGSKENYIKYIDEPVCAIEYDARKYGESYGKDTSNEVLLRAIPVDILERYRLDILNERLCKWILSNKD